MSDWIAIATVLKPHGVKGAFKIKSASDFKEDRYQVGQTLRLELPNSTRDVTVESYADLTAGEVLKLTEINDRDEAFSVRGGTLYFDKTAREDLEDDAFYYDELEGALVYANASLVGHVKTLHDYPQGTMLRIQTASGEKLVPFLKVFIEKVDASIPAIYLKDWEGLL
jgi:16S rRNA processing protein RimM